MRDEYANARVPAPKRVAPCRAVCTQRYKYHIIIYERLNLVTLIFWVDKRWLLFIQTLGNEC